MAMLTPLNVTKFFFSASIKDNKFLIWSKHRNVFAAATKVNTKKNNNKMNQN